MNALLEKIAGKQKARQQKQIAGYHELVAAIATGNEPDPTLVEETLAKVGKSLTALQADVDLYQKHVALKAMVAMLPDLEEERKEVDDQLVKANQELEDAEDRHADVTTPLLAALDQIKAGMRDASDARQELFETCNDPALRSELDKVNGELNDLANTRQEQYRQEAYFAEQARIEFDRSRSELTEGDREHRREQSAMYQEQVQAMRKRIKATERASEAMARRREQIEQRMRDW